MIRSVTNGQSPILNASGPAVKKKKTASRFSFRYRVSVVVAHFCFGIYVQRENANWFVRRAIYIHYHKRSTRQIRWNNCLRWEVDKVLSMSVCVFVCKLLAC